MDSITNDGKNIAVNKGEDTSKGTTLTSKGTTLTSKGVTNKDDDTVIVGEDGRRASPGNN